MTRRKLLLMIFVLVGATPASAGGPAHLDTHLLPPLAAPVSVSSTSGTELPGRHGLAIRVTPEGPWVSLHGRMPVKSSRYPSGFLVRDAAVRGPLVPVTLAAAAADAAILQEDDIRGVDLRFRARYEAFGEGIRVSVSIADLAKQDRAISVYWAIPFPKQSLVWFDDLRTQRAVPEAGEIAVLRELPAGATGKYSAFPLGAVAGPSGGLALGVPMDRPAIYRLGYSADSEQLYLVFDFGLAVETAKFPRRADFSFIVLAVDPAWGFRSALERYYATFPELFARHAKREGIWVFADISGVEQPEDFGFMFHEMGGSAEKLRSPIALDDRLGVMSFRYTTPIPYNLNLPKSDLSTYAQAIKRLEEKQAAGDARARAQGTCGIRNEDGTFWHQFVDYPWVQGVRFAQDTDPELPETGAPNRAHQNYDPQDKAGLYVGNAVEGEPGPGLDGEYLDSLGMFSGKLDFDRSHFATADVPLTFATATHTPCLIQDWCCTKFCRWVAEDLHRKGKLLMSNGHPDRFCFMGPWIDVLGREVHYWRNGHYQPEADAVMNYRREVCFQKPFVMLMNDDFARVPPEVVERYMKRATFYGFYPSMFEFQFKLDGKWKSRHYFAAPDLYNRDRPLFKKYIPLLRTINAAGWQPVTCARCGDPAIWIERFGPAADGNVYFTVLNSSAEAKTAAVTFDGRALPRGNAKLKVNNLANAAAIAVEDGSTIRLELSADDLAVLEILQAKTP